MIRVGDHIFVGAWLDQPKAHRGVQRLRYRLSVYQLHPWDKLGGFVVAVLLLARMLRQEVGDG